MMYVWIVHSSVSAIGPEVFYTEKSAQEWAWNTAQQHAAGIRMTTERAFIAGNPNTVDIQSLRGDGRYQTHDTVMVIKKAMLGSVIDALAELAE